MWGTVFRHGPLALSTAEYTVVIYKTEACPTTPSFGTGTLHVVNGQSFRACVPIRDDSHHGQACRLSRPRVE